MELFQFGQIRKLFENQIRAEFPIIININFVQFQCKRLQILETHQFPCELGRPLESHSISEMNYFKKINKISKITHLASKLI